MEEERNVLRKRSNELNSEISKLTDKNSRLTNDLNLS